MGSKQLVVVPISNIFKKKLFSAKKKFVKKIRRFVDYSILCQMCEIHN